MRPFSFSVVTVLDCGATRTSLGVFNLTRGQFHCLHFGVASFADQPAGEDRWLENTSAAFSSLNAGRMWSGPAVLVLPAHLTLSKQIKVPRVERAKREKILRFEAGQAIPPALGEVVWDAMVSGRRDGTEDVTLVATKREITEQLCAAAEAAGFRPWRLLPSLLATLGAFRLARPGWMRPALVLNFDGRSTTLLQVDEGRFASRTLVGGAGLVTSPQVEMQACERLAQEVDRTALHFGRQCAMGKPERVFLTGGGAQMADPVGMLSTRLTIPVELFEVSGAVTFSRENSPGPALTDLIGAAAIILQPSQPVMDLLPPRFRERENLRRRLPWLGAAALLLMAALALPIRHYREVASTARARVFAMEEALAPLRARELRNRANLARLEQIKAELVRLESVQARRTAWLRLLAGLEERLVKVEDVWLEKLQLLPPAADGTLKLAVSGRMLARPAATAPAGPAGFARVKELLTGLAGLPSVAGVEGERFDPGQPELLRFDFVLVTDPAHPL